MEKKANESKEMQTIQHERIQTIVQEQEEQRMDVKELKEKQQSMSSKHKNGDVLYVSMI